MTRETIPPNWTIATLGEIVETFYNGGTPSTENPGYWTGPIPWITGADIVDQKVAQPRKQVSVDGVRNSATHVVPKGAVLIVTRTGVGKVAIAPYDVAISQDITGAVPKDGVAIGEYIYWWFVGNAARLQKLHQGTSINGVLRQDLTALRLPIPPISQQYGIVRILSAIDDAIEKTAAVIAATERLRQALTQEMLTRGVQGWHSEWKHVSGIGTVPAAWEVMRLGQVAVVQTGRAVGKDQESECLRTVPYLSVANVKDGYLDLGVVKTMKVTSEEIRRFSLKRGDVLFTEGGDADKLGRGCVWGAPIDPCLHQNHVFAVRTDPGILRPKFLAMYARTGSGKAYFLSCAKQTTNLASMNSTQLREFPLPLPSPVEQDAILSTLESIPSADPIQDRDVHRSHDHSVDASVARLL